jgi:amidohydrolase
MPPSTDNDRLDDGGAARPREPELTPPEREELLASLLDAVEHELADAVELRHRLHEAPELSHDEHATAAAIDAALPVAAEAVAVTGRIARIGAGTGIPVAVRAELDGLPVREQTGAPFSASGETMHACGHDVHMAALVALTRAAHTLADELPAPLLAVFQPSEESYPSGAEQVAQESLEALGPRAVVAAHVHPELPWGSAVLETGTINASCDAIEILVTGAPTHGAYPHRGRDPILALSQIVVALHAQLARRIDPMHPATLTIGVIEGGSADNVIPAQARARGALRAHLPEDRETLRTLVGEVAEGTAAAAGCTAAVTLIAGEPALQNDPGIVAAAAPLLGRAGLAPGPAWRSCGSDDFAFYGAHAPLAMAFVGLDGAPGFSARPLHHPELLPPDETVAVIARVYAALYVAGSASPPPRR